MELRLTSKKEDAALIITLEGELNTLTAPDLNNLLEKELPGIKLLTLDFSGCDYVSSAGIRVLLATFKQMKAEQGKMNLTNVGENFMDVLENTGLDAVFDVI